MNEIYWLTCLDDVKVFIAFIIAICVIGLAFAIATMFYNMYQDYDSEIKQYNIGKCWTKRLGIIAMILGMITCFIPNTKEAYQIIGIGSTIEYLKENDAAKQLPDKCIQALDLYIEKCIDENSEK